MIKTILDEYKYIYYDAVLLNRIEILVSNIEKHFNIPTENIIRWLCEDYINCSYTKEKDTYYHTFRHMMAVANIMCLLLDDNECKEGIITGLYHDYGHSLGEYTDSYNIANAIQSVSWCLSDYLFFKDSKDERNIFCKYDLNRNSIFDAIFCTVYRFRVEPTNALEKAIRDADLLMCLCPDAEHFSKGLSLETKCNRTIDDMFNFVKTQKFYTEKAKKIFERKTILNV